MARPSTRNQGAEKTTFADFTGGLRLDIPADSPLFTEKMLQTAINVELDYVTGKLKTVDGLEKVLQLPAKADTLFYNRNDNYFLTNCGRTLYKLSGSLSPVSAAESIGTLTGIRRPNYAVYRYYTAIVSGGRVQYYGYKQPLTAVASSPSSTMCYVRGGRLCVANADGMRISMCGANDITNWQTGSTSADTWTEQDAWYADISPGTGGIAAIRQLGSNIIVVKSSGKTYRFVGDDPDAFQNYEGPDGVYVVGQNGLISVGSDLYYVGQDGFNALSFASDEYNSLKTAAVGAGVNKELLQGVSQNARIWDVAPKKQLWIRADDLGTTYLFHYSLGIWTMRKFSIPIDDVCIVGNIVFILAGNTIYKLSKTSDIEVNGNLITVNAKGKLHTAMDDFLIKRIGVSVDALSDVDAKVTIGKLTLPIGYTSNSPYVYDQTGYVYDANYPIWTLARTTKAQKRQLYRCNEFAWELTSTKGVFALNHIKLEVVGV